MEQKQSGELIREDLTSQYSNAPIEKHKEQKPLDLMPKEEDYTYGAYDASGEVYDMVDPQFKIDLKAWNDRQPKPLTPNIEQAAP